MKKHMSIEDRLDRIERILDDLEKRGDLKGRRHGEELFKFDSMGKLPKDDFPKSDDAMRQRLDSDFARSQPAAQAQDKAFAFQFGQARATADAQRAQTDALRAEQDRKQSADEALLAVKEGQRAVDEGRRRIEEGQRAVERAARDMARQARILSDCRTTRPVVPKPRPRRSRPCATPANLSNPRSSHWRNKSSGWRANRIPKETRPF